MDEFGCLNLLAPQVFTREEEDAAIRSSLTCDWVFGHHGVVEWFAQRHPRFEGHVARLRARDDAALAVELQHARATSLLMAFVMLTGECNADCGICYTARRRKPNELTAEEIIGIIDQTRALGARTLYVAGEGEPTLDRAFFEVIEHVKRVGMRMLFFTNGILLSNETLARRRWGISNREIVERLADAPVWVYHKLWSTQPAVTSELMGLPRDREIYRYVDWRLPDGRTIPIPEGLQLLLDALPRERVGIETVVERRTGDDIVRNIVPFIEQTGVRSYLEPIIHSGRNFDEFSYDPTQEQLHALRRYLVRQGCTRVAYKLAIHNDGFATPGISILRDHLRTVTDYEALNIRDSRGGLKDLFTLRHSNPFLVANRYRIEGCLCEEFNLEMSAAGSCASTTAKETACSACPGAARPPFVADIPQLARDVSRRSFA